MKVKIFGWRNINLDQISRIEEGLRFLGQEIVENDPEIIYSHDFTEIDKAYEYKLKYPSAKYLQKVLDLPIHLFNTPFFDLNKTKEKLLRADIILSNSQTVKNNIKKYLGLDSFVVYDAIKDVKNINLDKDIPFLYIGRANDPNKRFYLIKETFELLNIPQEKITIVGPDNPYFGNYKGIIDDEELNNIYNKSKYILFPSYVEGIGLPPIEGIICNSIPILCSDNETSYEFLDQKLICDPNPYSIAGKLIDIENNYKLYLNLINLYSPKYKNFFNKNTIAQNIINAFQSIK